MCLGHLTQGIALADAYFNLPAADSIEKIHGGCFKQLTRSDISCECGPLNIERSLLCQQAYIETGYCTRSVAKADQRAGGPQRIERGLQG